MIRNTLGTIGVSALGAFGLTLAILTPIRLDATEPSTMPAKVAPPTLTVNGVEFSALLNGKAAEPGLVVDDAAKAATQITLKAVNTTDQPMLVPLKISFASRSANPFSRVASPFDREYEQQEQSIPLAAKESRELALAPQMGLPRTSIITINLQSGEEQSPVLSFAVGPIPKTPGARTGQSAATSAGSPVRIANASR